MNMVEQYILCCRENNYWLDTYELLRYAIEDGGDEAVIKRAIRHLTDVEMDSADVDFGNILN